MSTMQFVNAVVCLRWWSDGSIHALSRQARSQCYEAHLRLVGGAQGVEPGEQEGLQRLGAARLHQPQRHLLEAGGRRRQLAAATTAGCWRSERV
jgi:hypothetical protein